MRSREKDTARTVQREEQGVGGGEGGGEGAGLHSGTSDTLRFSTFLQPHRRSPGWIDAGSQMYRQTISHHQTFPALISDETLFTSEHRGGQGGRGGQR